MMRILILSCLLAVAFGQQSTGNVDQTKQGQQNLGTQQQPQQQGVSGQQGTLRDIAPVDILQQCVTIFQQFITVQNENFQSDLFKPDILDKCHRALRHVIEKKGNVGTQANLNTQQQQPNVAGQSAQKTKREINVDLDKLRKCGDLFRILVEKKQSTLPVTGLMDQSLNVDRPIIDECVRILNEKLMKKEQLGLRTPLADKIEDLKKEDRVKRQAIPENIGNLDDLKRCQQFFENWRIKKEEKQGSGMLSSGMSRVGKNMEEDKLTDHKEIDVDLIRKCLRVLDFFKTQQPLNRSAI